MKDNHWIRGCPDFRLRIRQGDNISYAFIELKIKAQEYRKTVQGGITKLGSKIPYYGCTSYYLDKDPVWINMNAFCNKTEMSPDHFLILFANLDGSDFRIISLESINRMSHSKTWIDHTCGQTRVFEDSYMEGYGKKCFLIPKDTTVSAVDPTSHFYERFSKILCSDNFYEDISIVNGKPVCLKVKLGHP